MFGAVKTEDAKHTCPVQKISQNRGVRKSPKMNARANMALLSVTFLKTSWKIVPPWIMLVPFLCEFVCGHKDPGFSCECAMYHVGNSLRCSTWLFKKKSEYMAMCYWKIRYNLGTVVLFCRRKFLPKCKEDIGDIDRSNSIFISPFHPKSRRVFSIWEPMRCNFRSSYFLVLKLVTRVF